MTALELRTPAPQQTQPAGDVEAYALEAALRSLVHLGASTTERSRQRTIGASDAGHPCDRRQAYRQAGTLPSNVSDPLRAMIGTGVHGVLAANMLTLDAGSGRFLVETPIRYRGIPGTVDLFDRLTGTVVDWKTTLSSKLRRIRVDGPPTQYVTQVQIYGAGLAAAGETVRAVALAYVPIDAGLDELYVWRATPDVRVADEAADRLNRLAGAQLEQVVPPDPSTVQSTPSTLCAWCPYYAPRPTCSTSCKGD